MYTLTFDTQALHFLDKLQKTTKLRIWSKLQETKNDPFRYFERLVGRTDYKLRIGNYRVIADLIRKEKNIHVTYIQHRKNVYK